jgi:hypothetical protein
VLLPEYTTSHALLSKGLTYDFLLGKSNKVFSGKNFSERGKTALNYTHRINSCTVRGREGW